MNKEILEITETKELQKRLRAHIVKQFEFSDKFKALTSEDFTRRAKRADAFQEKVFAAGLKAIGISYDTIKVRQEKDMALALKNGKKRREQLIKESKAMAVEYERRTKQRQAMRSRFEKEVGNPRLYAFLCERAGSNLNLVPNTTLPTNPFLVWNPQYINNLGENVTRWRIGIQNTGGGFGLLNAILMDHFVWMCDREGVMDVEAFFHLNGVYDLNLVGMCFGHSQASLFVEPRLFVSQNVQGTTDVTLSTVYTSNALLNLDVAADCVNIVDSGMATRLHTGEISLTRSNFPLQANKPVIISVVLYVTAYAYNGASLDFDFRSESSFRMDVPTVALIVDS